jgi:SNF2 family DNA or RNA helicase
MCCLQFEHHVDHPGGKVSGRTCDFVVQALAVVQAFRSEWPVLIISPVSLKDNWACEAHRWLGVTDAECSVVSNPSELERAREENVPMVIANYELLSKAGYGPGKFSGGQKLNFNVVICDESHRIKNYKVPGVDSPALLRCRTH